MLVRRRIVGLALAISLLAAITSGANSSGFRCLNGDCTVWAVLRPMAILASLSSLTAVLLAARVSQPKPSRYASRAEWWNVLFSTITDFVLLLTIANALVVLFVLSIEAVATGHFQWEFMRSQWEPRDCVGRLAGLASLAVAMTVHGFILHQDRWLPCSILFGVAVKKQTDYGLGRCAVWSFLTLLAHSLPPLLRGAGEPLASHFDVECWEASTIPIEQPRR